MSKATKDRPLLLRLGFEESEDGRHEIPVTELDERYDPDKVVTRRGDYRQRLLSDAWPPRHEFSTDWLLKMSGLGFVTVTETDIVISLDNARAVYTIDHAAMEETYEDEETGETRTRRLSTGYWGNLKEGHVDG